MKRIPHLILALLLGLALTADAVVGVFTRANCNSISSPTSGSTWCFDSTANALKLWDGTAWVSVVGGQALPSYTLAGLPPAGTAGRLADVTDSIGGIHKDTGTQWIQIFGEIINVKDRPFNAKGDGTTDDTAAITAAISAAVAKPNGVLYFPDSSGAYITPTGGFVVPRRIRIISAPGAVLKLTSASATLLTYGSGADAGWLPGGIENLSLSGNGGASDTSIGLQIGSGTAAAHGITIVGSEVAGFGNGVVISGTGDAFGWVLERVRIRNNAANGLRVDVALPTMIEAGTISNSFIFNNGTASATGTGIQLAASTGVNLRLTNTHVDNNGNGTLAQIHVPATSQANLHLANVHFENAGGPDSTAISLLSSGANRSRLTVIDSEFLQNPTTVAGKPLIRFAAADMMLSHNTFLPAATTSSTAAIDVGAGIAGVGMLLTMRGNDFIAGGVNPTQYQIINVTGSGEFFNYDITGTVTTGYASAVSLHNIPFSSAGVHDLGAQVNIGGPIGARRLSGNVTAKRVHVATGTALVAGDFAVSAGWGVGATVTNVVGFDQAWQITVTAAGTPGANPTITLTYKDGTWTSPPVAVAKMIGGTGTVTQLTETTTATTHVVTFQGTPVAGSTYIISSVAFGT